MPITFSTPSGFFEWSPAAWLRVTGPDALLFLQGQFSQDLRMLAVAAAGTTLAMLWGAVALRRAAEDAGLFSTRGNR